MDDMFDNPVLCKNCNIKMQRVDVTRNGFVFRMLHCNKCGNKIVHPDDKREYNHYMELRGKNFNVKLRMIGNSYAISIPKEIINFINEQNKIINDVVRLSFERMDKLSLVFDKLYNEEKNEG
ncbi:MAG: hypothetical protein QW727_02480 [Candidatus Pacearchaeota archaeon]